MPLSKVTEEILGSACRQIATKLTGLGIVIVANPTVVAARTYGELANGISRT